MANFSKTEEKRKRSEMGLKSAEMEGIGTFGTGVMNLMIAHFHWVRTTELDRESK